MAQIKIGPEFFANIRRDYGDWRGALVREFVQNGIDADSSRIDITVTSIKTTEPGKSDSHLTMTVANNGAPMTEEILVNKLLCLGGSTKQASVISNSSVGGFGVAKSLLYCCHQSFEIKSGSLYVAGSGAEYDLLPLVEALPGTTSTIKFRDYPSLIESAVRSFAKLLEWDGTLTYNGDALPSGLTLRGPASTVRRTFEWGNVHVLPKTWTPFKQDVIVRKNGVPMFTTQSRYDAGVVVEITAPSTEVLSSNRDRLLSKFQAELDEFVGDLAVDRSKALRPRTETYMHFAGTKLGWAGEPKPVERAALAHDDDHQPQTAKERLAATLNQLIAPTSAGTSSNNGSGDNNGGELVPIITIRNDATSTLTIVADRVGTTTPSAAAVKLADTALAEDFVIRNTTGMSIPTYYIPGHKDFASYGRKLAKIWGRLLLQLCRLKDVQHVFSIGFVFDDNCEAAYENGNYGPAYFIAPAKVVEQDSSSSRSFRKRFLLTDRDRLLALAAHEFTHGGLDKHYHDESFACAYTDLMAEVLKERKSFTWCFVGLD